MERGKRTPTELLLYFELPFQFCKVVWFAQIFGQNISIRLKTLSDHNTSLVVSRHIKGKKTSRPLTSVTCDYSLKNAFVKLPCIDCGTFCRTLRMMD